MAGASWREQLASVIVGVAGGMAVNVVSGDIGYRGVATVGAGGAVLAAAAWLRQLPPGAPLARWSTRSLLSLAVLAVVGCATMPTGLSDFSLMVAVSLTMTAVLIPSDFRSALYMLAGAAFVALGMAIFAADISTIPHEESLSIIVRFGAGAVCLCLGIGLLRRSLSILGMAIIALGTAFTSVGITQIFHDANPLFSIVACLSFGPTAIIFGIAALLNRVPLMYFTLAGVTIVCVFLGSGAMLDVRTAIAGALLITIGALIGSLALAQLHGRTALPFGLAGVMIGIFFSTIGCIALMRDSNLAGAALIGIGIAYAGIGIAHFATTGILDSLQDKISALTRDPSSP